MLTILSHRKEFIDMDLAPEVPAQKDKLFYGDSREIICWCIETVVCLPTSKKQEMVVSMGESIVRTEIG